MPNIYSASAPSGYLIDEATKHFVKVTDAEYQAAKRGSVVAQPVQIQSTSSSASTAQPAPSSAATSSPSPSAPSSAAQSQYPVGTKLRTPFGTTLTVSDANQFFSAQYVPVTGTVPTAAPTSAAVTNPVAASSFVPSAWQPGESILDYANRINAASTGTATGGATGNVVGTSESERAKLKAEIKADLFPSGAAPSVPTTADERIRLRKEQGVINDELDLTDVRNEARQAQEEMRVFRSTAGQRVTEAGRLGAISEAERNLNFRVEGWAIREQALVERINSKNAFINQTIQDRREDYNAALQKWNAEFTVNAKINDLLNDRLDRVQKDALTVVTTITNLMKESNTPYEQWSPEMQIQAETAALKIGLPKDVFRVAYSNLGANEKVLSTFVQDNSQGGRDVYSVTQDRAGQINLLKVGGIAAGSVNNIKENLANWQVVANQITTGGFNYTDLTPEQKKKIEELETSAGLPPGFTARLKNKNPKADVLSVTTRQDSTGASFADVLTRDPDTSALKVESMYLGPKALTSTKRTGGKNASGTATPAASEATRGAKFTPQEEAMLASYPADFKTFFKNQTKSWRATATSQATADEFIRFKSTKVARDLGISDVSQAAQEVIATALTPSEQKKFVADWRAEQARRRISLDILAYLDVWASAQVKKQKSEPLS